MLGTLSKYKIIKVLGSGSFGQVSLGKDTQTGMLVAIKKMNKFKIAQDHMQNYLNSEISIMQSLNHPNLVKFYGVDQDNSNIFLIQEYCNGGNLEKYTRRYGRLEEKTAAHILRDICGGLYYLHQNNIIHRDLKPENILINCDDMNPFGVSGHNIKFKICDFGLSKKLLYSNQTASICGTPGFCAPEIGIVMANMQNNINCPRVNYDNKVDIWSIGAIAYKMLTGSNVPNFNAAAVLGNLNLSPEAKDFLRNTLSNNASQRFDIMQVCAHPFLTQGGHVGFERGIPKQRDSNCFMGQNLNGFVNSPPNNFVGMMQQNFGQGVSQNYDTSYHFGGGFTPQSNNIGVQFNMAQGGNYTSGMNTGFEMM